MDPLPSMNHIFSMVLQHERQNCLDDSEEPQVLINAVDGKRYFKGKPYGGKYCTFCNRTRHTVDYCFQKHGFPPGSKMKPHTFSANNVSSEVENSVNFGSQGSNEVQETQVHQAYVAKHVDAGIACNHIESHRDSWILDSSATDHICTSLEWF